MTTDQQTKLLRKLKRLEDGVSQAWNELREAFPFEQCACCQHFGGARYLAYQELWKAMQSIEQAQFRLNYWLEKQAKEGEVREQKDKA